MIISETEECMAINVFVIAGSCTFWNMVLVEMMAKRAKR